MLFCCKNYILETQKWNFPPPCFSPPNDNIHETEPQHPPVSPLALLRLTPVFTPPHPQTISSGTTVLGKRSSVKGSTAHSPSTWAVVPPDAEASLITELPTELLLEIFKRARNSLHIENTIGRRAPPVIILSQVCHRWRLIIHGAPLLWQHLVVAPREGKTKLRKPMTKWLSRVPSHLPVDVHVTDANLHRRIHVGMPSKPKHGHRGHQFGLDSFLSGCSLRTELLAQIIPNDYLDSLLPHLLTSSKSFRSLRTHLPVWSYVPKSGLSLGLLQHAPLDLPKLELLDLTISFMGVQYPALQLNRSRRLYDEAFVDGVINTFSVAPELKSVRIAFDGTNDRKCEKHMTQVHVNWGRDHRTGLEIFDLPYHQLETLVLENITTACPTDMRWILAAGVNLKRASLAIGEEDFEEFEDLDEAFDPASYHKHSYGTTLLIEEEDDVDRLGYSDPYAPGIRYVPPPVPPTLIYLRLPDCGTVPAAQLIELKSLHVTLHGIGGAAELLRGFSFPALEELSIVHATPVYRGDEPVDENCPTITPILGAGTTTRRKITADQLALTRDRLSVRARASYYPYEVLGSSLLHLQRLSSSFSRMRSLHLENLHGVNATHLLEFIESVGASLTTLSIQYCPNVELDVFAEGMSSLDDKGVAVLAPNVQTFVFEADLTRSGDNPNDIVNMLATRICPTPAHTGCPDDEHRTKSRITTIGVRFFGKRFTEDSWMRMWKFEHLHKLKVNAQCWYYSAS
ncbi:hypothetical protein D9758_018277 [Tetrapyrgos nigripes]|uniref:F-box domain-containing protein n=1 Tax=Tetrapyrgos nigripes TaxID=182062 RepID=A0A8H5FDD6_9AGAR|nr:hypothetical protein D9758_018277 [Tetrapyrgos nigripes]